VDVHVSRLRKKLEGRRDVTIHTVVRQGYILQKGGDFMGADALNGSIVAGPDHYAPSKLGSAMTA
jgi:DNA-binding winged helix-turn-helix (wHTH) protein